jgi:hypothetical protein
MLSSNQNAVYGMGYNLNGVASGIALTRGPTGLTDSTIFSSSRTFEGINPGGFSWIFKYDPSGNAGWIACVGMTAGLCGSSVITSGINSSDSYVGRNFYPLDIRKVFVLDGPTGVNVGITGPQVSSAASYTVLYDLNGKSQWITRTDVSSVVTVANNQCSGIKTLTDLAIINHKNKSNK